MNFDQIRTIHFVGIGGIGMSGIAEILAESGVSVSGCDLKPSAATDLLKSRGIPVVIGHDREHLEGVDLVVVTAAVKGTHDEIDQARRRGIPIARRAEMLGEIMRGKRGVGIAGTHGKTTTSAMVATVLAEAGLDPTVLIGGMAGNFGGNAKSGKSDLVVVEADEYDRTFHELHPQIAVVTNIEADHLDYYGSFEAIQEAFEMFLGVDRRFQILGEYSGALIVDDYAHHPTEIRATLDAARRGYPARRVIALFQPHLYSRTRDFADDFARALKTADVAIVAPIYAAREKPIEGVSARMIADAESGIEFLDRSNS